MRPRLAFSPIRSVCSTTALLAFSAGTASACLQGHRFDAPKPLTPPVLPALPTRPDVTAMKFDAPRLEPLKLEGLLAAPPTLSSKIEPEAPAVGLVSPELHAQFVDYVRTFEAEKAREAGVADRIDYAVALVHLGRHTDAIAALLAIEAAHPGRYETAANLGTAYELAGNLEEAVIWIARGIERRPSSHAGTEWLHVAILRAKLKLRDDAAWLKEHSVLDGVAERAPEEIVRAIDYQLGERLRFVKPADAVVCDLFYQAALRVRGADADVRRTRYLRESLRFGDWRKTEIAALRKT